MRHSTLNPTEREADLTRLDEMIAALERFSNVDLLKEHLQSARQYLLGAMPEEYLLSLGWAKAALDTVPDTDIRGRFGDTIAKLVAEVSGEPRAS